MKKYLFSISCLWILTLAAAAQVNNYYVNAISGSDTNDGSQARPWLTFAHANAAAALGASGTIVHFADGTYVGSSSTSCNGVGTSVFCVSRGGSSTQQVIFQCDNGLNGNAGSPGHPGHCLLRGSSDANNQQMIGTNNANYVTIQGFDIGGDAAYPATQEQAAIIIYTKDGTGNHMEVSHNYMHDVATNAPTSNNSNGEGAGCPMQGVVEYDAGFPATAGRVPTGGRFIGNWIHHAGNISNTACNQFHGLYIGAGPNIVVQNNIVDNVPGSGIKMYASNCQSVVTNNLVFHTGWWGILVDSTGSSAGDGCAGLGIAPGRSTISNNIIVGTGFNNACGAIAENSGSGSNKYANNLLLGNLPVDEVNTNCGNRTVPSGVSGTINGTKGATPANTFVNYQSDGTGDYHQKAGSAAIGAGNTDCVSGGLTPCTPSTSFAGLTRPSPPSIGFDELNTDASQPLDAPRNLTAIVQ